MTLARIPAAVLQAACSLAAKRSAVDPGTVAHRRHRRWLQVEEKPPITVQQLADRFNEHARTYYRKAGRMTSEAGCVAEALQIACGQCGSTPAYAFGPARLKQARQAMIVAGWERRYINKQIDRIRRAFTWAVEQELLEAGPKYRRCWLWRSLAKGRSAAKENALVQPVADQLVNETVKHLPRTLGDMVRLQRLTGMRPARSAISRLGLWIAAARSGCMT